MLKILYILGNKNTENPIGFSLLNNPENFMKNLGKPFDFFERLAYDRGYYILAIIFRKKLSFCSKNLEHQTKRGLLQCLLTVLLENG